MVFTLLWLCVIRITFKIMSHVMNTPLIYPRKCQKHACVQCTCTYNYSIIHYTRKLIKQVYQVLAVGIFQLIWHWCWRQTMLHSNTLPNSTISQTSKLVILSFLHIHFKSPKNVELKFLINSDFCLVYNQGVLHN